ncbi:hypothetical protein M408DRAFT_325888 [Serendipita vermifera MAFF 305830]|uniref:Uncharacterized protein n=1 Tax=Serendipita vermifera MAFF 305830 TaxID=933852 RepID=A0A0C2Y073_SERVB|nr:hypothetical protein M408DRAFT_325888 [Serendipita vermifera MAFF 305830]
MCLRLFRNFVRSKVPGKKSKHAKAYPDTSIKPSEQKQQQLLSPNCVNNVGRPANGDHNKQEDIELVETIDDIQTHTDAELPEEDQRQDLLDALPPITIHEPFDISINPARAYFSALPLELKLEILDQFQTDFSIPSGEGAYQIFKRYISRNPLNLKALKALRLCDRELRVYGLHRLFTVANLTPHGNPTPEWLAVFEKEILPLAAQHVKYITIFVDEETDEAMARILRQLTHVRWLMLDLNLQSTTLQSIEVLSKFTNISRFTTISSGHIPSVHMETNARFLRAYGSKLKSLDLFNGWYQDPTDSLLLTIRDSCPVLQHFYLYGTSDTRLASILVEEPAWASRATLKSAHFEACKEVDAWIVASLVDLYPSLQEVNIGSCGGPGGYDDAKGRDEERERIIKSIKPIRRPPLDSLRIVHATDVEFRHMCSIPTKKLVVFDPLDQMLIGELLSQPKYFPGMRTFELQYVKETDRKEAAFNSIKAAIEMRGDCVLVDSRKPFGKMRRLF